MNIQEFQAKWRGVNLKERSAAQEHFIGMGQAPDDGFAMVVCPHHSNFMTRARNAMAYGNMYTAWGG